MRNVEVEMLTVIIGLLFIIAGGWGMFKWYGDFIFILKGFLPFMLFMGGLIAVVAGVTSITESLESKTQGGDEPEEKKISYLMRSENSFF
jgi:hypothetical protein